MSRRDWSRSIRSTLRVVLGAGLALLAQPGLGFAEPALETDRVIQTTPFVNDAMGMADAEAMAYVSVNDTLWLGDDDNDRIYEVDKESGDLRFSIGKSELATAVELGGTALAGIDRAAEIEALAYDAGADVLYVFSGSCCPRPPTAFRLVRTGATERFAVETFRALPPSSSFLGAAFHPGEGLYVSDLGVVKPYDYASNSLGAAVSMDARVSGVILGMGFSADGRDLWVVTDSDKVYRIDWTTKQVVEGYEFDLLAQGITDGRAVDFVDGQLFVLDGSPLPDGDPRRLAVTVFNIVGQPTAALAAPSGLTATVVSSSEISLAWVDNSDNEDGFKIERCQGVGCTNFVRIATAGADVTGYADAGLTASTSYTYRVRAYSAIGDSANSNAAAATTLALPPAAPSDLTAMAISSSEISLAWADNSGNESGFKIERCEGPGCAEFGEVATVTGDVRSYTDSWLTASTTYAYRVRANNSAGGSDYSNTASATTVSAAASPTLTFAPSDDATIKFDSPGTGYGATTRLEVDASPQKQVLLKFSVAGLESRRIVGAGLRLYNVDGSDRGGDFFVAEHNDWTEASVTWNTAPQSVGSAVASLASVSPGAWSEVDLTHVITGEGTYSFRVGSSSTNAAEHRSKEAAAALRPRLVLTMASEEPPPPPGPLTVDAGPDQVGGEGTTFSFVGAATGGTPPYAYAWSFGDGAADSGSGVTHRYVDSGAYIATLTVSDAAGQSVQDTVQVSVANEAPTASAGGPYSVTLGVGVTLKGSATDPSSADTAAGLSFAWDFGDGTTGSGASPTHAYPQPGTYSVQLVVTDKDGGSGSATTTVTVVAPTVGRIVQVPTEAASVQLAVDLAVDGDTVLVAPGTYLGNIVLSGKTITLASWFHTTGDPSFIARTVLDGSGGTSVIRIDASVGPDTAVVGFTIQSGNNGILAEGPFQLLHNRVVGNGDGVEFVDVRGAVVRSNTIKGNNDDGVDVNKATSILIEDNVIERNGDDGIEIRLHAYTGPTLEIVIRSNIIAENGSDGIQLIDQNGASSRVFSIEKNLFRRNVKAGLGLMANGVTQEDFSGASIPDPIFLTNNTFVGNDHAVTGGDNITARNNIFAGSTRIAVKNVDATSTVSHSLFWSNGLNWQASNIDEATSLFADPLFDGTYHLLLGSPAIDAGMDVGLPYNGPGPDLGAYETSETP